MNRMKPVGRLCARRRSYDVRSPHRPVGFAVTQRAACGRRAGVGDAVSDLTDMDVLSDDEWAWGANGVDPTRSRVRMSRRGARHWAAALVHSLSTGGSLHASEKRGESRPPPFHRARPLLCRRASASCYTGTHRTRGSETAAGV
jgi:hypothetical protein